MERVEADHAKADQIRTAREVAAMFDELRRLADRHAELSADRARLEAEAGALRAELEGGQSPGARLEAEAHGARLDTAAASRMADEANRRAADLADRLTAAINEKVELLKAPEAERRRPWWRRLFKR